VKGENIVLMDLREVTPIADYFVICSGNSDRQLKAIVEKVTEAVKKDSRVSPLRVEGLAEGGWVLVDYGGLVIHAFSPDQRDYYRLEELWSEGKTIVRMQ
jgi:ribosome-associated protein